MNAIHKLQDLLDKRIKFTITNTINRELPYPTFTLNDAQEDYVATDGMEDGVEWLYDRAKAKFSESFTGKSDEQKIGRNHRIG